MYFYVTGVQEPVNKHDRYHSTTTFRRTGGSILFHFSKIKINLSHPFTFLFTAHHYCLLPSPPPRFSKPAVTFHDPCLLLIITACSPLPLLVAPQTFFHLKPNCPIFMHLYYIKTTVFGVHGSNK